MITKEDYLKSKRIVQEYESKQLNISDVSEQLPINEILDNEYKRLMKSLYPNRKIKFKR